MKQRDVFTILVGIIIVQLILITNFFFSPQDHVYEIPQYYKIHEEDYKNWTQKLIDDPIAFFTMVLTLSTFGLYLSTRSLWNSTEKLVSGAEKTAIMQLRAYVSVKEFGAASLLDELNINIGREIYVVFQNTGATPTKDLVFHTSIWHENRSIPESFRYPDTWVRGRLQTYIPTTLSPGCAQSDGNFRISVSQLQQIARGEMNLFIYGYADYNDVFVGTERHRTEFCARLDVVGDPAKGGDRNMAFSTHSEHNGTDEECMRKPLPLPVGRRRITPV